MHSSLFKGKLVRLTAEEPATQAAALARWQRDSEYWRMMSGDPMRAFSQQGIKTWVEKNQEQDDARNTRFSIRTLVEDLLIGDIGLHGISWTSGEAWVGIGIGEREYWSRGYGTDAMRLILQYAFMELNLHRVSLEVLENNPRGLRSYEKAGFKLEGRQRQVICREGRRWDVITMGILRSEWAEIQCTPGFISY